MIAFFVKHCMVRRRMGRTLAPGMPEGFLANGVKNQVVLSWEPVPGADSYEIWERAQENKDKWTLVGRTAKRKVVLGGKSRGKTYFYKMRACKKRKGKRDWGKYSKIQRVSLAMAGESTLWNFLNTALAPVGSTMYIWGGGWNKADTGTGADGRRIGLHPKWRHFAAQQSRNYNYRKHHYKKGCGLDCSGFVGWVVYNTFHTENGKMGDGYVCKASNQARLFADKGWGAWKPAFKVRDYRPGDIMSGPAHVYIVLGQCPDGSVVLVHSSPSGVQLCGTVTRSGKANAQAVKLAEKYMKTYFPSWYRRFPECSRGISYRKDYSQFRWHTGQGEKMEDPEGLRKMDAAGVLKKIFR